ncbi:MAG: MBL fold metallo-hydrolase [Candidatus Algichlamydia australiensis]|nr:MBL fold metallo-hydrolase [Chlamydiales bacterium]
MHTLDLGQERSLVVIPALTDNYIYLLKAPKGGVLVDPGETVALPKEALLAVLLTHRHSDHVNGAQSYKLPIIGPEEVPFITEKAKQKFTLGDFVFETIHTPGHTLGHNCYYLPKEKLLFAGDTLFGAGCGKLFEGSAETLYSSLQKLKQLPDETRICSGHEYTEKNLRFAQTLFPENCDITKRLKNLTLPELPTLETEKRTNPFMLARNAEEFAQFRKLRDQL